MSTPVEAQKAGSKAAETSDKDDTRTTVTGGVEKPSSEEPKDVAKPSAPAKEEGATESAGQADEGSKEGGEQKGEGGQSESMIRSSYLPTNKLKDAPPPEKYEGKDPMEFAKGGDIGTSEIIKEKMSELKDKMTGKGKKTEK